MKQIIGMGKILSVSLLPPDSSEVDEGVASVEATLTSLLDGSVIQSYPTHPVTHGEVEFILPAPTDLDVLELKIEWVTSNGLPMIQDETIQVVGEHLVSMSAIRKVAKVADRSRFSDRDLADGRDFVEGAFEKNSGLWFREQIIKVTISPGTDHIYLSPTIYGMSPQLRSSNLRDDRAVDGEAVLGCNQLSSPLDSVVDAWLRIDAREEVTEDLEDALAEWVADRVALNGKKRNSRAKSVTTRQGTYEMNEHRTGPSGVPAIDEVLENYCFQGWS